MQMFSAEEQSKGARKMLQQRGSAGSSWRAGGREPQPEGPRGWRGASPRGRFPSTSLRQACPTPDPRTAPALTGREKWRKDTCPSLGQDGSLGRGSLLPRSLVPSLPEGPSVSHIQME